jgi:predicted nucleotidyltransferase
VALPDLTALLRALSEAGVEFVVVGGVAVAAHEYVRATEDVDLVPAPDHGNLDRLANVLVTLEGRLTLNAERAIGDVERQALLQGRNLSVSTKHGDLDVIQRLPGVPSYDTLRADAIRVEIDDLKLTVCSREHLMSMKRARGAPIDIADLERLTDTSE